PRAPRRRREPGGGQAARLGGDRLQEAARPAPGPGRPRGRRAEGPGGDPTMKGYGGRVLSVDLTSGASRIEPLDVRTARRFLGGNGLAARLLYDRLPPGTGPFAPGSAVVVSLGPITDTTVPGNSRACVASKSPLTRLFFDSTCGGRFPATLKRTGFDAVLITGCTAAPSYLLVTEAGAEVKPAPELWGMTTREAV